MEQVYNRREQIKEANLSTRYKPGQSGNPKGRPKNSVTTLLKNRNEEDNRAIADKLYSLALKGDMSAIREYIDRTDGKVIDKHQIEAVVLTPKYLEEARRRLISSVESTRALIEEED